MTLRLNKFCFCFTTRTGSLIIGTVGWILTLLQIFARVDLYADQNDHPFDNRNDFDKFRESVYFRVGWLLVNLLVFILLVVGVYRQNRRYVLSWLVLKGVEATLLAIGTIVIFCFACVYGEQVLFVIFVVILFLTVLLWYFWLCVYSHYIELVEPDFIIYSTENIDPPPYVEKNYNMA